LAYLCGAKERVGFSSGGASFLYTSVVGRSWNNGQSEIEKNIDLLRVQSGNSNIGSWVFNLDSPSLLAQNVPVKKVPRRIILSIGSPWPTKDWPVQNVVQYINQAIEHDCEVVLTGDQSAIHKSKEIENSILSAKFVNRVGQTTLEEWVDLIASAELVVSGDSASIHVASDLKVPVLALFGPTVPDFGFAPWRSPSLVLGVNDLKCRPCDIHGPKTCPLGHHKCMTNIKPEKVWGFSSDFIEKRRL
jgi:heptosyltransferase-2